MLLRIRGWSLRREGFAEASGVEGEGFNFAFVALGGNRFAFEGKGEAGGVAGFYDDLSRGANGGACGRDQSFGGDGIAVGGD